MRVRDLPASGNGVPQAGFDFDFTVVGETEAEQRALGPGPHSVDAAAVIRAWQDGLGLVPLDGGGFAPLPQAWLDKHGAVLARLLAARAGDGRLANHALPALGRLLRRSRPAAPGRAGSPGALGRKLRTPARGQAARGSRAPPCGPTSRLGSTGWPFCAAWAWAASSPTTWAWAKPSRPCACSRRDAWSYVPPACCPTGAPRWRASARRCGSACTTARPASSTTAPTSH